MPTNAHELNPAVSPKLGFKLGLQSAMDTMLGSGTSANAVHGTFYLTQDTHRLYVGNADGSVSAVNEGVIAVSTINDLPSITTDAEKRAHAGQFYYITSGEAANVLCVCSGGRWVQINAISKLEYFDNEVSTTSGVATVNYKVRDSSASSNFEADFKIAGAGGNTVSSSGDTVTITGNTGSINVSANGGASSNKVDLNLVNSNASNSAVEIDGGGGTTVSVNNDKLVISSVDTTTQSVDVTSNSAGFGITITDTKGQEKSDTFDPVIAYGDQQTAHFVSGTATLNVYSKGDVDTLISNTKKSLNAMTYKGTCTGANLPTVSDNVQIGDTYVLTEAYTYGGHLYPAGSLFIANGTEDATTGYITSPLTWDAVDNSGTDSQYAFNAITHGVKLVNTTTTAEVGQFQIQPAANNVITLTDDAGTGRNRTVTIAHAAVTRSANATGTAVEVPNNGSTYADVITGITDDGFGHITQLTVSRITLRNTQGDFATNGTSVTSANNAATVSLGYKLVRSDGSESPASSSFGIASDNLTVAHSGTSVSINLVWGSF